MERLETRAALDRGDRAIDQRMRIGRRRESRDCREEYECCHIRTLVRCRAAHKAGVAKGELYVASGFTSASMIARRRRLTGSDTPLSNTSSGPLRLSLRTSVTRSSRMMYDR